MEQLPTRAESATPLNPGAERRHRSGRVPAVVLGSALSALGVTRCLSRHGIPVLHLNHDDSILLRSSRWFRPLQPGGHTPRDAQELETCLAALPAAVLFPCSDDWVRKLGDMSEIARERFPACLADFSAARRLADKGSLATILSAAGLPHPRTFVISAEDDFRAVAPECLGDALVKPVDSQAFLERFQKKAFRVSGREAAIEAWRRAREAGVQIMLQEYVPGPADAHFFVDGYIARNGQMAGLLIRRRLRINPPDTGNSSAMITVPPETVEDAIDTTQRLLEYTGFRGIFSAEFKRHARDGSHRLLEVNVRPWIYVEFAAWCGVDVTTLAYHDALGEPLALPGGYRTGKRCVHPYHDALALARLYRNGALGLGNLLTAWWGARQAIFAWDDPAPALVGGARWARGWLGRRWNRRGSHDRR